MRKGFTYYSNVKLEDNNSPRSLDELMTNLDNVKGWLNVSDRIMDDMVTESSRLKKAYEASLNRQKQFVQKVREGEELVNVLESRRAKMETKSKKKTLQEKMLKAKAEYERLMKEVERASV